MSKKTILVATAGVLLMAGAVAAVSAPGHRGHWRGGSMMFGGDADGGHGMRGRFGRALTKDEFDAKSRERFARLDKNSDGIVDTAELEAAINERMSARHGRRGGGQGMGPGAMGDMMGTGMLRRMGAGSDGKLTKENYRTEITRRFAELDLNGDGRIDDTDLPPMMRGRNVLAHFGDAAPSGMSPGMRHGGPAGGPMGWLRRLGVTAKDGAIARDDVVAAADKQFDRLDRNKDGVVDQTDMAALRKEMLDYRIKRMAHRMGAGPDGRVTREQFQAKAAERFARLDLNGDGTVGRGEGWGRHGGGGHRGGGHRGPHGGMGPMHGGPAGGPMQGGQMQGGQMPADVAPAAPAAPKN